MNLKLIVAILVIAAMPVCAQAQKPGAAVTTTVDAQMVLKIISGDKAKRQIYCDMTQLGEQIAQANEKKDNKAVDELSQKLVALEEKLGPEYAALMDGLQDINPESKVGQEIESVLIGLDRLCGG